MGRAPPFFLAPGGPFHALTRRLGLAKGDGRDVARLSLVFGFAPWLGLMLISVAERLISGKWPLVAQAPSVHVRLLVTIPAFFLAERSLHVRTQRCIERIEGFVEPPSEERFRQLLKRATSLRDALFPELLLLAIVALLLALAFSGAELLPLGGGQSLRLERTPISLWYGVIAVPVFQFLTLRWIWRWLIWTTVLVGLSLLALRPIPSHPDRRGGIGFLAEPAIGFAYILFGASAVLASGSAFGFDQEAFNLTAYGFRVLSLTLLGLIVVLGPLLPFARPLFRARFAGIRAYDELAADYTTRFQQRWLGRSDREGLLGTSDIQSLADMANSYDVVREMRLVPINRDVVVVTVGAVLAPYLVVLLAEIPLAELLQDFANSFLGQLF
ncbi:MAG: hypothetical protein ACOX6T_19300 [Myxococcales bacterium]